MQVLKIWISIWFVLQLFIAPVSANQETDPSVFDQYGACVEYRRFLNGRSDYSTEDCHALPKFLMTHTDLPHQEFIVTAAKSYRKLSGLSMMLNTLYSFQNSEHSETFYWADQADRTLFAKMHVSQDYSRAYLYSLLLSGIKYEVLETFCEPSECNFETVQLSATDELGEIYSIVDKAPYDMALMCLLRTDGFVIPVTDVVSSQRFKACLLPS